MLELFCFPFSAMGSHCELRLYSSDEMAASICARGAMEDVQRLDGKYSSYRADSFVAEVNRAPFDLPEAEQELTAGYLTEFSGLRWSIYQMAEYINMITVSSVASTLFLGGYNLPFMTDDGFVLPGNHVVPLGRSGKCPQ